MEKDRKPLYTGTVIKLPEFIHFVCQDCAERRLASLKEKHYTMESMCDFCQKHKKNVHSKEDYQWETWQISNSTAKKWACDR